MSAAKHMAPQGQKATPYPHPRPERAQEVPQTDDKPTIDEVDPEDRGLFSNPYELVAQTSPQQEPEPVASESPTVRKRRGRGLLVTIMIVAVLAGVGFIGWYVLNHFILTFNVTVNGTSVTVARADTVQSLLDAGYADPAPGDLLAIDGSLLTAGGGKVCSVTIDGQDADETSLLTRNAAVEIGDGADVTEEEDVAEEAIPYGTEETDRGYDAYWMGSIHQLSKGKDGLRRVRTGKVSGIQISEDVEEPKDEGFLVYTVNPADRVVALTFDDGPWPDSTSQILDILQENGAKATFFTIGNQVADHADEVKRASDMGCEICTHTWDHASGSGGGLDLTHMSADEQVEEVQKGYAAIKDVLGSEPQHIMRAPGGNFYGDIIGTLWDYVDYEIGWNIDTEDWKMPGVDAIREAILGVEPGQVILMHDGGGDRSQTVEALRQALPQLKEQGYQFVTISELVNM